MSDDATHPGVEEPMRDGADTEAEASSPAEADQASEVNQDPGATDHPVGREQAERNAAEELPG